MKNNSNVDKGKAESKDKPKPLKLHGNVSLKAKKGCVLPIRYVGQDIVRITPEKFTDIDWGSLPYESKIMIRRSLVQGHILLKGAKQ